MRGALLILTLATVLLAGIPPAAVARPRVWIEDVILGERFGRNAHCYATGSILSVGGSGFLPRSSVRFGKGRGDTTVELPPLPGRPHRWGRHRCPPGGRQRPELRPLRRRDYLCEMSDVDCPPPVTGIVAPRWLVPWD